MSIFQSSRRLQLAIILCCAGLFFASESPAMGPGLTATISPAALAATASIGATPEVPNAKFSSLADALRQGANLSLSAASGELTKVTLKTMKESMLWGEKINFALAEEARAIARILLWAVLFAEITFVGFRIMLGSSIVEQLGRLTLVTFIYLIVSGMVILPGAPAHYNTAEGAIRSTMFRMMHAGKYVGAKIISTSAHPDVLAKLTGLTSGLSSLATTPPPGGWGGSPSADFTPTGAQVNLKPSGGGWGDAGAFGVGPNFGPASEAEPVVYWLTWIGTENIGTEPGGAVSAATTVLAPPSTWAATEYKFSKESLFARIWGVVDQDISFTHPGSGETPGTMTDPVTGFVVGAMHTLMPAQLIGMTFTIAGVQIGAVISIAFTQMSVLIGAIMAFNVAAALGLAVLPLMYFKSFDKIWSQYLMSLGSIALVPLLYYVMSAVGFVFSTYLFEQLFPIPSGAGAGAGGTTTASLATILNSMFFAAVNSTLPMIDQGLTGTTIAATLQWALLKLMNVFLIFGRILFASTIVAGFITAGATIALLAPKFAFRWHSAFGAEEVMEKMGEIFTGIQSNVGTGLGQMYSDTLTRASNLGKGLMSGLK